MSLVVDASATIELLLRTPAGRLALPLLEGQAVAVPAHFDAEVFSAIGRLSHAGQVAEESVTLLLETLVQAPFDRYSLAPLLIESWQLRHNVSQRDALYVVLARRLEATLLTADARLSRAPSLEVPVTLLPI